MCGIYGILRPDGLGDLFARADGMRDAIRHRGPDHNGRYVEPALLMGINRLAIVDVEGGNQPIFNEDGSLVIVYNGELYNHPELRVDLQARGHVFKTHTDTETVLHAFEEYGQTCLDRFNGMFALAIWNTRTKTLFLARDRLGIKPLYVAELPGGLAFASEAKALLPLIPGGPRPNWTAIHRFFSFGYVPAPDSPFEGICKFPAGHYAFVQGPGLVARRYWAPEYGQGDAIGFENARERLHDLLDQAVRKELMSDVPVGVFLSGGLDSSAVAAFARRHCPGTLRSFALRFDESTHDESADARLVADHLGLEHHELRFGESDLRRYLVKAAETLDEPFADSTVLPLLAISEFAGRHVRVVLTGWGGDEIFVGYPTYRAHILAHVYRLCPRPVREHLVPAIVNRLPVSDRYMSLEFKAKRFIQGMDLPPEIQHFLWMGYLGDAAKGRLLTPDILAQVDGGTLDPVYAAVSGLTEQGLLDRIMHLDASFFLEGNGLFQADRMTMAASLEARVPLLNHDLLSFVNGLPVHLKARGGRLKGLLKSVLTPYLPPRILHKRKKGFGPPSSAWTRGPLAATLERTFHRDKVEGQGILRHEEVHRLLGEHRERRADHGRSLWALLSFQLWYDTWIERRQDRTAIGAASSGCSDSWSERELEIGVIAGA
jgi:asparagine synthase (glutamine-hydrolysing)